MTNLTEQGKTHYYIKLPNNEVFIGDDFALSLYRNCKDGDKVEVLDKVPDYEKWKAFNALDVAKENTKLKELLKRVDKHFKWVDYDDGFYVNDELWEDIKKVLGEE